MAIYRRGSVGRPTDSINRYHGSFCQRTAHDEGRCGGFLRRLACHKAKNAGLVLSRPAFFHQLRIIVMVIMNRGRAIGDE
jgi:hypothetical protein